MDARDFLSGRYLRTADLEGGPRHEIIASVDEGRYGRLEVIFKSGNKLSLNSTNRRALAHAFGNETDGWRGGEVELRAGHLEFNGKDVDSIIARPIRRTHAQPPRSPGPPAPADESADNLPF